MLKASLMNAISELKRLFSSPPAVFMTLCVLATSILMYSNEVYKGNNPDIFPHAIGALACLLMIAYLFGERN